MIIRHRQVPAVIRTFRPRQDIEILRAFDQWRNRILLQRKIRGKLCLIASGILQNKNNLLMSLPAKIRAFLIGYRHSGRILNIGDKGRCIHLCIQYRRLIQRRALRGLGVHHLQRWPVCLRADLNLHRILSRFFQIQISHMRQHRRIRIFFLQKQTDRRRCAAGLPAYPGSHRRGKEQLIDQPDKTEEKKNSKNQHHPTAAPDFPSSLLTF